MGGDSYRPRRLDRDRLPSLVDRMTFTSGGGHSYDSYRPGEAQRHQDSHRPSKHSEFTFTSGRPGPQFPPTGPSAPPTGPRQPPRKRNRGGASGPRDGRHGGNSDPSQLHRRQNGARRGGFRKLAPHERALLQNHDGGHTERTLGVAEGSNKFKLDLDNMSLGEETDVDVESNRSTGDNDVSSSQAVEQTSNRADGNSVPKWSNPDPYTVLPPPEETTGKKRDFVKFIRKAKNEPATEHAAGSNAVAANDDFISFGDDNEDDEADAVTREDNGTTLSSDNHPLQRSLNEISATHGLSHGSVNGKLLAEGAGLPPRPGKVQKRRREREEFEGAIIPEWLPYAQSHVCPWVGQQSYAHLKHDTPKWLHNEILDFHDYVRPHELEQSIRSNLVSRIQNALGFDRFPQSIGRVYAFGSFPTGLYLPTADMDLVYTSDQHYTGGPPAIDLSSVRLATQTLRKASRRLESMHIATNVVVISKARVPIIKFVDRSTGIRVDLSFENMSGVQAQSTFENWKLDYPDMQYLVALLKQFLVMRGLNDVHTGGLGGFTIICLAVNYIHNSPKPDNLGELFLGFLDFYGNRFDLAKSRIQMKPPKVLEKSSVGIDGRPEKPDGLSIQDPNRPENNISGGSHRAKDVFKTFSLAHQALKDRMTALSLNRIADGSILECILGGNYESYDNHRRHLQTLR